MAIMAAAERDRPDAPAAEEAAEAMRRCLATDETRPRGSMIRFVLSPDGTVVPDVAGRLPGRGMWLSPNRDHINTAAKKNLFARSARRSVSVSADLADEVEALLAKRCVETLSLARRAGQAVAGFEKVKGWLAGGRAVLVLCATDGAPGSVGKTRALAGSVPVLSVLSAAEIGRAFGRDAAVHAAMTAGGLTEKMKAEAARLAGLRSAAA